MFLIWISLYNFRTKNEESFIWLWVIPFAFKFISLFSIFHFAISISLPVYNISLVLPFAIIKNYMSLTIWLAIYFSFIIQLLPILAQKINSLAIGFPVSPTTPIISLKMAMLIRFVFFITGCDSWIKNKVRDLSSSFMRLGSLGHYAG